MTFPVVISLLPLSFSGVPFLAFLIGNHNNGLMLNYEMPDYLSDVLLSPNQKDNLTSLQLIVTDFFYPVNIIPRKAVAMKTVNQQRNKFFTVAAWLL